MFTIYTDEYTGEDDDRLWSDCKGSSTEKEGTNLRCSLPMNLMEKLKKNFGVISKRSKGP